MKYVYTCSDHPDIREEVIHSMKEDPVIGCSECGKQMHRVPQPFTHYNNPADTLVEYFDNEYRAYRTRKAKGLPE